jgi:hypothetical protein
MAESRIGWVVAVEAVVIIITKEADETHEDHEVYSVVGN